MERVVLRPYWRESLNIAASITSMSNANPYPYILTNCNLFQRNAEMSTGCPNDAALFKSVEKSHPESPEIPESLSTNHLQNQWEWWWIFQFPNEVGRYLLIWVRVGLFNRFTHCSIIRATHWHFSVGLKQITVCQNARIWIRHCWCMFDICRCCYE